MQHISELDEPIFRKKRMLRSRLFHLKCRAHRQMGRALQTIRPIKWLHYGERSKCCDRQGKFSHIFWMSIVYWAPVHSPYTLVLHLPNWLVVPMVCWYWHCGDHAELKHCDFFKCPHGISCIFSVCHLRVSACSISIQFHGTTELSNLFSACLELHKSKT